MISVKTLRFFKKERNYSEFLQAYKQGAKEVYPSVVKCCFGLQKAYCVDVALPEPASRTSRPPRPT